MKKLLLSLLFALLLVSPSVGMCSEKTYTITEEELTQLTNNLTELQSINSQLMNLLEQSGMDLTEVSTQLLESKNETKALRNQLIQLQTETKHALTSLERAQNELKNLNLSLQELEKEEKRIKRQRDMWETIAGILGVAIIVKSI